MASIPVTMVTGFLGAGKTTLINEILRDPAFAETAVLINEFGDVQVDHDLVAEFSDHAIVTTTGCLCCTASSDIKQSLHDLLSARDAGRVSHFSRVIVETTGLMDPVPVIAALLAPPTADATDQTVSAAFHLARVITLFDIVNGAATLDRYDEARKQIAFADWILLTKTDLAKDPVTLREIESDKARLNEINPGATLIDRNQDWSALRAQLLSDGTYDLRLRGEDPINWLKAEQVGAAAHDHGHQHHHDHHGHDHHHHGHDHGHDHSDRNRHGDDIRADIIILDQPVRSVVFSMFLDALKLGAGENLLRLKGLVALADDPERPLVVHGVQHLIHPIARLERWPSDDHRSKIVVIGRDINTDMLRNILAPQAVG